MYVVLYHKDCIDGFFAASELFSKFNNNALYIPVDYKSMQERTCEEGLKYIFSEENLNKIKLYSNSKLELFNVTEKDYKDINLIVVDYSFPLEHFQRHCELFNSVNVIDHHETAFKNYTKAYTFEERDKNYIVSNPTRNSAIHLSDKMSGAKLTYILYNSGDVPKYIELVSSRDMWTFDYPETNHFFYGMRLINTFNFEDALTQVRDNFEGILEMGKLYELNIKTNVKKIRASSVNKITIDMDGKLYICGIVNGHSDIASDLCNTIIHEDNCDMAFTYTILKDFKVGCSVRSAKSVSCLPLAEKFGGGGHKNASGFSLELNQLLEILDKKYLKV